MLDNVLGELVQANANRGLGKRVHLAPLRKGVRQIPGDHPIVVLARELLAWTKANWLPAFEGFRHVADARKTTEEIHPTQVLRRQTARGLHDQTAGDEEAFILQPAQSGLKQCDGRRSDEDKATKVKMDPCRIVELEERLEVPHRSLKTLEVIAAPEVHAHGVVRGFHGQSTLP